MPTKKNRLNDVISNYGQAVGNRGLERYHVKRMVLCPDNWATCQLPINLTWNIIQFRRDQQSFVPNDVGGVYAFVVQPNIVNNPYCSYLLYIGKAKRRNFRARYADYLNDLRLGSKSRKRHIADMLKKWDGYLWFCYARVDQEDLIDAIEASLLTAYLPPTNKEFPGEIGDVVKELFGT